MSAVVLKNLKTGQASNLEVKCVIVAIGHTPNTEPFAGKMPLDGEGSHNPSMASPTRSLRANSHQLLLD
jgi:thioredoxin reductase